MVDSLDLVDFFELLGCIARGKIKIVFSTNVFRLLFKMLKKPGPGMKLYETDFTMGGAYSNQNVMFDSVGRTHMCHELLLGLKR